MVNEALNKQVHDRGPFSGFMCVCDAWLQNLEKTWSNFFLLCNPPSLPRRRVTPNRDWHSKLRETLSTKTKMERYPQSKTAIKFLPLNALPFYFILFQKYFCSRIFLSVFRAQQVKKSFPPQPPTIFDHKGSARQNRHWLLLKNKKGGRKNKQAPIRIKWWGG